MNFFNKKKAPDSKTEGTMSQALTNGGDYTTTTTAKRPSKFEIDDDMTANMVAIGGGDMPPHARAALAGKTLT